MKYKLMIDDKRYYNKPSGWVCGEVKNKLDAQQIPVSEATIEQVIDAIENGQTIVPAVVSGGSAKDWVEQQLFLVDIDNASIKNKDGDDELRTNSYIRFKDKKEIELLQPDKAIEICKAHDIVPIGYYYTFSHTEKNPKFRLIFATKDVIRDEVKRKVVTEVLVNLFEQSDKACKNADRTFYGTNKKAVILDADAKISLDYIYSKYVPSETKYKKQGNNVLEKMKQEFDFQSYLVDRNGEYKNIGDACMFSDCELCGHHDDLVFYPTTNTYHCFGGNGGTGGSIIDYLMHSEGIESKDAISKLYELSGAVPPKRKKYKQVDSDLLAKLKSIKPEINYSLDDIGYGRLYADIFKNVARYNTTVKEWYVYNGKIWVEDTGSMVVHGYAKALCDVLLAYGFSIIDDDAKEKFLKWVGRYSFLRYRETMIKDARSENFFSKDDLDKDIYMFNCQNGTLNLKTFEFLPHSSDDLLSKISNVHYDPKARCERWEAFIDEVLESDANKINYLQKLLGYSLTGLVEIEQCFILYGSTTRNGKSTAVETFGYMLGNVSGYALSISPETLAVKLNRDSRNHSSDVARLKSCRFINAAEPPKRMLLDSALIKNWTGGDTITAREIFERQTEFKPTFKLYMNTNFLPQITDDTLFASNRINVITFNRHFKPHEQDLKLKSTLREPDNISGIFNWCLDGLRGYYAEGLKPPESVIDANSSYRESSDKIGQFLADCMTKSDYSSKISDVYLAYNLWCDESGLCALSKSNFIDELKTKNVYAASATILGKTVKNVVKGYSLIYDPEEKAN